MIRSMRVARVVVTALTLVAAVGGEPAEAQDYSWSAAWYAGGSYFTDLNANGGDESISLDPGWIAGLQFDRWFGSGRIGTRVNGALTQRPMTLGGEDRDVGLWLLDASVLLRLLAPSPERRVNATLGVGAGMVKYRLGSGGALIFDDANATYSGDDSPRFAVTGSFGLDFLTGWRWDGEPVGIRVEIADHVVFESPFAPIGGDDFAPIHNARLVIGAFTGFGLLR